MEREEIIKDLRQYFEAHELVGPNVYHKYGDESWFVFETNALHCLLLMREGIGKSFSVNNWFWKGNFSQRGYRDNTQEIVKSKTIKGKLYLSGHVLGNAFDFTVKGMISEDVRDWIIEHQDIFPCKIRLEHKKNGTPISWVHFDNNDFKKNSKIYLFNV